MDEIGFIQRREAWVREGWPQCGIQEVLGTGRRKNRAPAAAIHTQIRTRDRARRANSLRSPRNPNPENVIPFSPNGPSGPKKPNPTRPRAADPPMYGPPSIPASLLPEPTARGSRKSADSPTKPSIVSGSAPRSQKHRSHRSSPQRISRLPASRNRPVQDADGQNDSRAPVRRLWQHREEGRQRGTHLGYCNPILIPVPRPRWPRNLHASAQGQHRQAGQGR